MNSCRQPPPDAHRLAMTLVGSGEPLLRLEKRLSCAAAGLGLALELEICKDADALGLPYSSTPAVVADGEVVFSGLPRTEEIEGWLRARVASLGAVNSVSFPDLRNPRRTV